MDIGLFGKTLRCAYNTADAAGDGLPGALCVLHSFV
jgi:hypothetical protein